MTGFLFITLYAPLVSWGDIAVGELRGTWDRPSRSAILGLVAAACGIEREDVSAHESLESGYGLAVRLDAVGTPMTDYQTAQTIPEVVVKKRRHEHGTLTQARLMADEDRDERQTILSRRAYRQDALATAALWERPGARWTLRALCDALRRPVFILYAGRKANAFGLPLGPEVVSGDTLSAAFASRRVVPEMLTVFALDRLEVAPPGMTEIAYDDDSFDSFVSGLVASRRVVRRDHVAHRGRWQFAERIMSIATSEAPGQEAPNRTGVAS